MIRHRLPAAVDPQSRIQPTSSLTVVVSGSKRIVAVCATGLASTASTPGRRPSTASIRAFELAQSIPRVSINAISVSGPSVIAHLSGPELVNGDTPPAEDRNL